MAIGDARRFVERMKQDRDFRKKALATAGPEELLWFLEQENMAFDWRELVGAMAECMENLESQSTG